jgi:hypothetical protein
MRELIVTGDRGAGKTTAAVAMTLHFLRTHPGTSGLFVYRYGRTGWRGDRLIEPWLLPGESIVGRHTGSGEAGVMLPHHGHLYFAFGDPREGLQQMIGRAIHVIAFDGPVDAGERRDLIDRMVGADTLIIRTL